MDEYKDKPGCCDDCGDDCRMFWVWYHVWSEGMGGPCPPALEWSRKGRLWDPEYPDGFLCVSCFESRLGRKLCWWDYDSFNPCNNNKESRRVLDARGYWDWVNE